VVALLYAIAHEDAATPRIGERIKGRAILAIEKGPPGEAAFKEAFATWK
jgi:hypothetical protein